MVRGLVVLFQHFPHSTQKLPFYTAARIARKYGFTAKKENQSFLTGHSSAPCRRSVRSRFGGFSLCGSLINTGLQPGEKTPPHREIVSTVLKLHPSSIHVARVPIWLLSIWRLAI